MSRTNAQPIAILLLINMFILHFTADAHRRQMDADQTIKAPAPIFVSYMVNVDGGPERSARHGGDLLSNLSSMPGMTSPISSVQRTSFLSSSAPRRPFTEPSDLAAVLFALPGILTTIAGFLLMCGPYRRPDLGALLYFLGLALMMVGLAGVSFVPFDLSNV
jgi:hypothetical protein